MPKRSTTSRHNAPRAKQSPPKRRPQEKPALCRVAPMTSALFGSVLLIVGGWLYEYPTFHKNSTGLELLLSNPPQQKQLLLTTIHGVIKIKLRPDLSPESVQHIEEFVSSSETNNCEKCQFYRREDFLLQGVMKSRAMLERPSRGACPPEFVDAKQHCPVNDKKCACHGPTMHLGAVGWAGGGVGPDFFITTFDNTDGWWEQTHTVWGMVEESESLYVLLKQIMALPTRQPGGKGMTLLQEPIGFQMSIE